MKAPRARENQLKQWEGAKDRVQHGTLTNGIVLDSGMPDNFDSDTPAYTRNVKITYQHFPDPVEALGLGWTPAQIMADCKRMAKEDLTKEISNKLIAHGLQSWQVRELYNFSRARHEQLRNFATKRKHESEEELNKVVNGQAQNLTFVDGINQGMTAKEALQKCEAARPRDITRSLLQQCVDEGFSRDDIAMAFGTTAKVVGQKASSSGFKFDRQDKNEPPNSSDNSGAPAASESDNLTPAECLKRGLDLGLARVMTPAELTKEDAELFFKNGYGTATIITLYSFKSAGTLYPRLIDWGLHKKGQKRNSQVSGDKKRTYKPRTIGLKAFQNQLNGNNNANGDDHQHPDPHQGKKIFSVMPKPEWDDLRRQDLRRAITDYIAANLPVPEEWLAEYNQYAKGA